MPDAQSRLESGEVLDLLASLVQKSLVLYEEDEQGCGRYRLLETVRQYSRDRLLEAREGEAVRDRHRDWFLALAEQVEPELAGARRREWLERLEREYDNLLLALTWTEAQGHGEVGVRLGGALVPFWGARGYLEEGWQHLARLLALPGAEAHTLVRARALQGAGGLARPLGAHGAARALFEESAAIFRELGDRQGVVESLGVLGLAACNLGEYGAARAPLEECLAISRELGDPIDVAWRLSHLGVVACGEGDSAGARALFEESMAIFRERGRRDGVAWMLHGLGWVARETNDAAGARALFEESLVIHRELGGKGGTAESLMNLGEISYERGEYGTARRLFQESLTIFRELGQKQFVAWDLKGLGAVAAAQAQPERAARLFGAAEGLPKMLAFPVARAGRADHDRAVAAVRTALGEEAFARAWAAGRTLSLEDAVRYALEAGAPPAG